MRRGRCNQPRSLSTRQGGDGPRETAETGKTGKVGSAVSEQGRGKRESERQRVNRLASLMSNHMTMNGNLGICNGWFSKKIHRFPEEKPFWLRYIVAVLKIISSVKSPINIHQRVEPSRPC